MLAGAAVRTATHPVRAVQSVVRAAGDLDAIPLAAGLPGAKLIARAARLVSGDRQQRPELPSLVVPRTPLNGPISARRHLSFGSLSLKDVKSVAKANSMSVNDVVMSLCTSALRSWLRERDALPEAPLIVAVPVAVRTAGAKDLVGNQISAMVAPMPTNVPDARERLQAVGATMGKAKRRFALAPATWLSELCSLLPAPVTSLATPAIFRLAALAFPPINLIISNVPGPQFPLYLCGGRLLSYYPLSVLTDVSGGLNITCFSYDGMLDFGIVACPERMNDVWGLLGHLRTALDELLDERVGDEFRDGVGIDLVAG
jgi:WS/DGAT/MGAT family acyltransferase